MTVLSLQNFAGAANQAFDLEIGATSLPLTLVEVVPLPAQQIAGMVRQPFTLTFRSASQVVLPQKIYPLRNATMGAVQIFLVPIGRDRDGILYQAVFN